MKEKILNIGIVAHADAGKTTLTEQLLYAAGAIRTLGSVDAGTASTDTLEIERSRGISVRTACAGLHLENTKINLIDAPGHSDFLSEVERSLSVLDGAVLVISAVEGIQPQTRMLLQAFIKERLPFLIFLNKIDRAGSRSGAITGQLSALFPGEVLPMTALFREGAADCESRELSLEENGFLEQALMACGDEELLEEYVQGGGVSPERAAAALSAAVNGGRLLPVIHGASKYGVGISPLLKLLCTLLKEPVHEEEFCARVFQVEHHASMGKAAYVRLFGGKISPRDSVKTEKGEEKITGIRVLEGTRWVEGSTAESNDVALLYGLSSVKAGDILGRGRKFREYRLSEPLLLLRLIPQKPQQLMELCGALQKLGDEDPTLGFEWNREKQEIHIRVCGKMQIEVLKELLKQRWNLEVRAEDPSVIYRETPATMAEGFDAYLMPKPCWAVVRLRLEPLPQGAGFQYESKVSAGRLALRYQAHIETSLQRCLKQGLWGWEVTDLKVTLLDGESHHVHTHPLDFFVATPMAFMDGLRKGGSQLLEPILQVELSAPESALGKTISLLVACRGSFDTPVVSEGLFSLSARVPAAQAIDFPVEFAALTGGEGVCGMCLSHYEPCPQGEGACRERIGADPLERPKFILAARSAISDDVL